MRGLVEVGLVEERWGEWDGETRTWGETRTFALVTLLLPALLPRPMLLLLLLFLFFIFFLLVLLIALKIVLVSKIGEVAHGVEAAVRAALTKEKPSCECREGTDGGVVRIGVDVEGLTRLLSL